METEEIRPDMAMGAQDEFLMELPEDLRGTWAKLEAICRDLAIERQELEALSTTSDDTNQLAAELLNASNRLSLVVAKARFWLCVRRRCPAAVNLAGYRLGLRNNWVVVKTPM